MANPSRPSNPFAPTSEPDWVKVERPVLTPRVSSSTQPALPLRSQSVRNQPSAQQLIARKLPPPYAKSATKPEPLPPRLPSRSPSVSSTTSRLSSSTSNLRKPAPPIPTKPNTLQSPILSPIPSSASIQTQSRPRGLTSPVSKPTSQTAAPSNRSASGPATAAPAQNEAAPPLPPPRRSATTAQRIDAVAAGARGGIVPPSQRVGNREQEVRNERVPALPPRRGTGLGSVASGGGNSGREEGRKTNLMDEDESAAGFGGVGSDSGRGEIKGWETLKPS